MNDKDIEVNYCLNQQTVVAVRIANYDGVEERKQKEAVEINVEEQNEKVVVIIFVQKKEVVIRVEQVIDFLKQVRINSEKTNDFGIDLVKKEQKLKGITKSFED